MRGRAGVLAALFLLALPACRQERAVLPESSPPPPRRIIALTPSLVETLFALGLGDRVVGVGDYARWPPEVRELPQLGGLFNPNLERIVSLKPDLAVLLPSERELADKLRRFGVGSLVVQDESLADVERSFHTIAERCGAPDAGERLAAEWRAGLAPDPLPGSPRVVISAGRATGRLSDLVVAGPGTFFDELLARLGAVNAFADAPGLYPEVGLEEVVARAPDVILEMRAEAVSPAMVASIVRDWRPLPQIPAVREGRIEVIAGDYVVIPGPRLPQLYREMRAALEKTGSRK